MSSDRTANPKRSLPQQIMRIALWMVAIIALLIGAIAAWAWTQRYALIERQAITYLQSMGIDADLRIRSATGTEADVRNIRLSYEDTPFLTLDRMQASYQWRDLLGGQVERLDFTGLTASITVDEDGNIIDGWRPPSSGDGAGLPLQGIGLTRAKLTLNTPYGTIPVSGDAEISSTDRFQFDGEIQPTALSRNDLALNISGPISVARENGPLRFETSGMAISAAHPSGALTETQLTANSAYDLSTQQVDGMVRFQGGEFTLAAGAEGEIRRVEMSGLWSPERTDVTIDANLPRLGLTDADRRADLSRTLSLADVLADVPVAQNFAPDLVQPIAGLLKETALDARMRLEMTPDMRRVTLRDPVKLTGQTVSATLSPVEGEAAYRYRTNAPDYQLALQASLSGPVPLELSPLQLIIRSDDGVMMGGIEAASGTFKTSRTWRSETAQGTPARLAPLSVDFDYRAPEDAASNLTLTGTANYDGDIPGGYIIGLKAGGRLATRLQDETVAIDFRPRGALSFTRLDTTSEWIIEDFSGTLRPGSPIYARSAQGPARVRTGLADTQLTARRDASDTAEAATLAVQITSAELTGSIGETRQDWASTFMQVALQSETFPVEGTDLTLPEGMLDVSLLSSGRSEFRLSTPGSTLITPIYRVRDMALEAEGTAEAYRLTYQGGRIRVVQTAEGSAPLPVLSASGDLNFADGQFTGTAQATIPQVPDNPVMISYSMFDGRGEAAIALRDLRFRPRGLQPQELAPALRGKIAQVDGAIDADLRVAFGGTDPISGTGSVEIKNMSLGTAPGPITGLSGTVELTSLFPVVTAPNQILRIDAFDPGFPLENGVVTYALVEDGVDISSALFPFGEGRISFDPFIWTYGAPENRVTLRVSDVQVAEFLKDIGDGKLSVSGTIEGEIPVVVSGIDVKVDKGRLEVPYGGTIRYSGNNPIGDDDSNPAATAFKALENFNYQSLFAEIDGPLDGAVSIGMLFTGSNPDVLYDVPFQFDVTVEGELFNIARSLNPNGLQDRVIASVTAQQLEQAETED